MGAEASPEGTDFRVWAPKARRVELLLESGAVDLRPERGGYHGALVPRCRAGARYRYLLDGRGPYPDPASRFQPDGPHGPSEVVDPGAFPWSDGSWKGLSPSGQVIYELHLGTFTPEGTWDAAASQLPRLRDLGITAIELMPVADFPGRFGWGYDGVNLFAPCRLYGRPDDFRRFVDRAHGAGLGVMLDVVYNHFGPGGNFLGHFSGDYVTDRYPCEWGAAVNFDGESAGPVREFFVSNAEYWIVEFHLDGLRFDATQAIFDRGPDPILRVLQSRIRAAAGPRGLYLTGENEPQDASIARPATQGGQGLDALWNDDFHHEARVALTGCREAYFTDYGGTAQELVSAARWGFLYQGQRYSWQGKARGTPALDLPSTAFVHFLENHDQVANSGHGRRLWQISAPGPYRALTALLLLGPATPFLFQGQEYGSTRPFFYFADHAAPLGDAVAKGRAAFLAQFPSLAGPRAQASLPHPADPATFERSKLDPSEIGRRPEATRLHRDLLELRRSHPALRSQRNERLHGSVLAPDAFALRWMEPEAPLLLLVNLGPDRELAPAPDPLLAPPDGRGWQLAWSSEDLAYGGRGTRDPFRDGTLILPGGSAVLLGPGGAAP